MLNLTVLVKPFDFSVGGFTSRPLCNCCDCKDKQQSALRGVDNQEHIFLISVTYAKNSSSCETIYFRFSVKG